MSRVIKFRGKADKNHHLNQLGIDVWIYGYYMHNETYGEMPHAIFDIDRAMFIPVIAETVGQFVGFLDKNEKEIYENDHVLFHYFYGTLGANMGFEESEHTLKGIVKWGQYGWGIENIEGEHWKGYTGYENGVGCSSLIELLSMNESSIHEESFEVVANIYQP